jgi:hypothetical protein
MKAEIHMMRRLVEDTGIYGQCLDCERMRERPTEPLCIFTKKS